MLKVTVDPGATTGLAPLHPRNNTFPGEVYLGLVADALAWSGGSRVDPVALKGMAGAVLVPLPFPWPEKHKLQFAA